MRGSILSLRAQGSMTRGFGSGFAVEGRGFKGPGLKAFSLP